MARVLEWWVFDTDEKIVVDSHGLDTMDCGAWLLKILRRRDDSLLTACMHIIANNRGCRGLFERLPLSRFPVLLVLHPSLVSACFVFPMYALDGIIIDSKCSGAKKIDDYLPGTNVPASPRVTHSHKKQG